MENKKVIKENEFIESYNSRRYEANCFNEDGSLNKNYNFWYLNIYLYENVIK